MKEPESADHIKKCNKQGNISSISANGVAGDTVQEHVKKSKGRPCRVATGGSAVESVTWMRQAPQCISHTTLRSHGWGSPLPTVIRTSFWKEAHSLKSP